MKLIFAFLAMLSITAQAKDIAQMELREKLATEFATAWNKTKSVGDFFAQSVDPKLTAPQRKNFQNLTEGYRWFPTVKAVAVKDTIFFHDEKFKTIQTVQIWSLRPLVVEQNGHRVKMDDESDVIDYFADVKKALPSVLQIKNSRSSYSQKFFRLLESTAIAADDAATELGPVAMKAGVIAYSAYEGVRAPYTSLKDGIVTVNIFSEKKVLDRDYNLPALSSEQRSADKEWLLRSRENYRLNLGRWARGNFVTGGCLEKGSVKFVTKGDEYLPSLNFSQEVKDDIHSTDISLPGATNSLRVEKVFTRNSDVHGTHRVFADEGELTSLQSCNQAGCKALDEDEFSEELTKYALEEKRGAALRKIRETFGAEIKEIVDVENKIKNTPQGEKLNQEFSSKFYKEESELKNWQLKAEAKSLESQKISDEVGNLLRQAVAMGSMPKLDFFQIIEHSRDLASGKMPASFETPSYQSLLVTLEKAGTTENYKRIKAEEMALKREAAGRYAALAKKKSELLASYGLDWDGQFKKGQDPASLIAKTKGWQKYKKVYEEETPELRNLYLVRQWLSQRRQEEENEWLSGGGRGKLSDLIATNYAFALCCDDKECAKTMNAQLRLRDRGNLKKAEEKPAQPDSTSAE